MSGFQATFSHGRKKQPVSDCAAVRVGIRVKSEVVLNVPVLEGDSDLDRRGCREQIHCAPLVPARLVAGQFVGQFRARPESHSEFRAAERNSHPLLAINNNPSSFLPEGDELLSISADNLFNKNLVIRTHPTQMTNRED